MTLGPPLAGKTVLVTGAGRGIGRGIALAAASAGANVVVTARREKNGAPVAAEVADRGAKSIFVQCDVTDRTQVDAAVAAGLDAFGRLDVLVHNAVSGGSADGGDLASAEFAVWDAQVAVALRASYYCAQAAHPHLRASPAGRFILLASSAGIEGSSTLPLYAAVKGGQRGFAKSLAREWGPDGITVNCLAPVAETPALTYAFKTNPVLEERLRRRTALGRIGDPENDIGAVAVFLASDAASYITGQTLVVDGGSFMGL